MSQLESVKVFLNIEEQRNFVGSLERVGKKIYFKYDNEFLELGLSISPYKLALSNQIFHFDFDFMDGLPGVFYDSLPDGWGRLLMDKYYSKLGVALSEVNVLDRLSLVGNGSWGALEYEPSTGPKEKNQDLDIGELYNQAMFAFDNTESANQLDFLGLSLSSGGARPKISVLIDKDSKKISTPNVLSDDEWIVKFVTNNEHPDFGKVEWCYQKIASDCGIPVMPYQLLKIGDKTCFATKRFDRTMSGKKHCISMAGLVHDNFRLPAIDYGHLMNAAFEMTNDYHSLSHLFKQMVFNILLCNRDDHSKNFAFIMSKEGAWTLSPAYDLTFSIPMHGHHSITIDGESLHPRLSNVMTLAETFNIQHAEKVIERIKEVAAHVESYFDEAGISKELQKKIIEQIKNISNRFFSHTRL